MPSSFPHFPPAVVHDCRCDWVRQLMLRSAWLHSTLRELPPACFGALLLHLPACWQRLAFMVESQQEVGCQVMWAVQCRPAEFAAKFPEFAKWRTYGEQSAPVRVSGGTGMTAGAGWAGGGSNTLGCTRVGAPVFVTHRWAATSYLLAKRKGGLLLYIPCAIVPT
jgi:hypothetical protein